MMDVHSPEFLQDSQTAYFNPPYHNFRHGLEVRDAVLQITHNDTRSPLAFAATLHDACHTWEARAPWDEKIAVKISQIMWRNYWLSQAFINESEIAIMWTVFNERANLILPNQKTIADADLSALWSKYEKYLLSATMLLLETHKQWVTDQEILDFFRYQKTFFNSLTEISWTAESCYFTPEAREAFPHFAQNKDQMSEQVEENPDSLIDMVRRHEKLSLIQSYRKEHS